MHPTATHLSCKWIKARRISALELQQWYGWWIGDYCWWFRNPAKQLSLVVYPHCLQGFVYPRWWRISSINSSRGKISGKFSGSLNPWGGGQYEGGVVVIDNGYIPVIIFWAPIRSKEKPGKKGVKNGYLLTGPPIKTEDVLQLHLHWTYFQEDSETR